MAAYAVPMCEKLEPVVAGLNFRRLEWENKDPPTVCPTCGATLQYDWAGYEEEGQLPVPVRPRDPARCRAAGGDAP